MTRYQLLQFVYLVANGDRAIFSDVMGLDVEQLEEWLTLSGDPEIPDSEWLDERADIWRHDEMEARRYAQMTGEPFEMNTLGFTEWHWNFFEGLEKTVNNDRRKKGLPATTNFPRRPSQ